MKKTTRLEDINIYKYLDYIKYLKDTIEENAQVYGFKAKIAEAANCQRSHLSLVLKKRAHFSLEQGIGVSDFLKMNLKEKNYFLLLIQFARAGSKKLKSFIKIQIEDHVKEQENLSRRINEKAILPEEKTATVYSSWEPLAIIIALSLPNVRTISEIAERLQLKKEHVKKILENLKEISLVENHGLEWRATEKNIHLPKTSKFNSLNHSHWRQKAIQNSFLPNDGIHYTSVCTLSSEDVSKMKDMMLSFIDKSREIVAPSKEEELYCLSCDWFKV